MKLFNLMRFVVLAGMFLVGGAAYAAPPTQDPVFTTTCSNTSGAPATWTLWAGQTTNAGTVMVSNDATNLYVTYQLDTATYPAAHFGALQLWVGSNPLLIPNAQGNPIPGQFPYKYNEDYAETTLTSYTFTIPLTSLGFPDLTLPSSQEQCLLDPPKLYVVTHAEVFWAAGFSDTVPSDTAYGGDQPGPSGNKWWFYGLYCLNCDNFVPPEMQCKTAFAKGGWVFVTDKKANPGNLPSLKLIKNRWGWAINLTSTGTTTYDIWAGAGLNDTSKGILVGTLTVDWNGTQAIISYNLTDPNVMDELHIYASDFKPTTTAPGQYGNTAYFNPREGSYTQTIQVGDTDGDGIWIIAHALACYPAP
jgi:hypothetical protein